MVRPRAALALSFVPFACLAWLACRGAVDRVYDDDDASIPQPDTGADVTLDVTADAGVDAPADAPADGEAGIVPCLNEGGAVQAFPQNMTGCAGRVTFANRATMCATGCTVCTAREWQARRGTTVPQHHYWTNDILQFAGTFPPLGRCSAVFDAGAACNTTPLHVCAPGVDGGADSQPSRDPENNSCLAWNCSFLDAGDFFGGCAGNTTAGTLCCCP